MRRDSPTPQIFPSRKLINLTRRRHPRAPPLRLRAARLHLLLDARPPTNTNCVPFAGMPQMPHRFRSLVAPLARRLPLVPVNPRRHASVIHTPIRIIDRHSCPRCDIGSGIFGAAPAVSAGEDVLDAFIGGQLAGLGGPGCRERAAVHVLELADFARFGGHGGHVAEIVGFDVLGRHDAGYAAEDGGRLEGGPGIMSI